MRLNTTGESTSSGPRIGYDENDFWCDSGSSPWVSSSDGEFIAYLWASVPGICDIGSYTGNGAGSGIKVDCGFTNGARFVLVKRTDGTGNWMYFDTLRGKDQTLALNTADAQKFGEVWPPYAQGF